MNPPLLLTALIVSSAAAALACSADVPRPKEGPGTAYPCGVRNASCGNHTCCDAPFTECGGRGYPNCPAGSCCLGDDNGLFGAKKDGGSRTAPMRSE